jgi:hypothetical protein
VKLRWKAVIQEWDVLVTYLCFTAYGVWSLTHPTPSVSSIISVAFGILFNVEMVVAGLMCILGALRGSYALRIAGVAVFVICFATIGSLILWGSGSPVGVLVLGLAVMGVTRIRTLNQQRMANRKIAQILTEANRTEGDS